MFRSDSSKRTITDIRATMGEKDRCPSWVPLKAAAAEDLVCRVIYEEAPWERRLGQERR